MVKTVVGFMGTAPHITAAALSTANGVRQFLDICKKHSINEIDTAAAYRNSEVLLGENGAAGSFAVATKAPAFSPHSLAKDKILANCRKSLADLNTDKVDIYYLHGPDHDTPLEEQCDAIAELHKGGKFRRFGVSNISPDAVRTIHTYCKSRGYCLPKIYQGSYNALQRNPENDLFPVLKELGMSFYAYSPLAGGLLAKQLDEILNPAKGDRYEAFPVFKRYLNDESVAGMRKLHETCDAEQVNILEASLRWLKHHSALGSDDAFIVGASKPEQLESTLQLCEKGPLTDVLVQAFEELWRTNAKNAAPYHF